MESISKLTSYWSIDLNEFFICSIDAASVKAHVTVYSNGKVDGLLNIASINEASAKEIVNDRNKYIEFVNYNKQFIITYNFCIYLIATTNGSSYPIAVIPSHTGAATDAIEAIYANVIDNCRACNIKLCGISHDGDKKWQSISRYFTQSLCDNYSSVWNQPLELMLADPQLHGDFHGLLDFPDILHILKNIRYRLCNSKKNGDDSYRNIPTCAWPTQLEPTISPEAFISIGIKPYILSSQPMYKMHDELVIYFFRFSSLSKCVDNNRSDLFLFLFAPTLLFESMFNHNMNRKDRIDALSIAFALVMIFYIMITDNGRCSQSQSQARKQDAQMLTLYDSDTCEKMLTLSHSLIVTLTNPRGFRISRFSSSALEHFFADIRRLCQQDDSNCNFFRCVLNYALEQSLFKILDIQKTVRKGRKDLQCDINEEPEFEVSSSSFQRVLTKTIRIIKGCIQESDWNSLSHFEFQLQEAFDEPLDFSPYAIADIYNDFAKFNTEKQLSSISIKKELGAGFLTGTTGSQSRNTRTLQELTNSIRVGYRGERTDDEIAAEVFDLGNERNNTDGVILDLELDFEEENNDIDGKSI